jgi:hypothetical protein
MARNAVIYSFGVYNEKRYSMPWVCCMTERGQFDFSKRVGVYTAKDGFEGDLVVTDPVVGQVYGYGQKDYRNPRHTMICFAKWDGNDFVPCDKLGR